jgi:phage-related minor tail protein
MMKRVLWISITAAALVAVPGCKKEPAADAQAQQQLDEAQKRLEAAEREAEEARRQLEEAQQRAQQAEQQRQLDEARRKLEQAQRQAADARRQLEQARQKAAQTSPGASAPAEGSQSAAQPAAGSSSPATTSVAPPPPAPKPVTAPAGTQIVIRTNTTLSTKDLKNGDTFTATLQQPLVVDGVTIAPRGAVVEGVVVESDPGGRVKGVAQLSIALRSLQTVEGNVDIQTGSYAVEAKSSVKKDVTRGAIMTGVGAAVGAIAGGGRGAAVGAGVGAGAGTATAMATRGEHATIPAESVLTFQLKSPVTVTVH